MSNNNQPEFRNFKAPVGKPPNGFWRGEPLGGVPDDGPINRVTKGWGREDWMLNNDKLCMKVLTLNFMECCSMHYHMIKEEIFFIVSGSLIFDSIDTRTGQIHTVTLEVGDTVHIPPGTPHKFTGADENGCVFVECSTQHFEDDSYRVAPGSSQ